MYKVELHEYETNRHFQSKICEFRKWCQVQSRIINKYLKYDKNICLTQDNKGVQQNNKRGMQLQWHDWDPIQYQNVIIYREPCDSCTIIEYVWLVKSGRINLNLKDQAPKQVKN